MKILQTKTLFRLIVAAGFLSACAGRVTPVPVETLDPADGIEVIVYTWDWPMKANIPPIHIWKDGHAVWVTYGQDNLTHVYEAFLSRDEVLKAQDALSTSGFWGRAQPEAMFTQASWLFLWANISDQEGVAPLPTAETRAVVASLQEILESSPNRREYFPSYGYLFVSDSGGYSEHTYYWPDDKVSFDFDTAFQGVKVGGEVLSSVWQAVQQGAIWIAAQKSSYRYELKIPGVSCVISNEPYMCSMYAGEPR